MGACVQFPGECLGQSTIERCVCHETSAGSSCGASFHAENESTSLAHEFTPVKSTQSNRALPVNCESASRAHDFVNFILVFRINIVIINIIHSSPHFIVVVVVSRDAQKQGLGQGLGQRQRLGQRQGKRPRQRSRLRQGQGQGGLRHCCCCFFIQPFVQLDPPCWRA